MSVDSDSLLARATKHTRSCVGGMESNFNQNDKKKRREKVSPHETFPI
jgi:hypothetical protein